jgi:hypothetical protein
MSDATMKSKTLKQHAAVLASMTLREKEIVRTGAATVTFEDHGQDFLTWHIKDRHVVGCEPFQARIWVGVEVTTLPMVGFKLLVRTSDGKERAMKYPVEKVEPFRMVEEKAS